MSLEVLRAAYAGGGPGFVTLRVEGRAHAPAPARLVPPTLLIADGGRYHRLAAVAGTPLLPAGPDAPPFAVDLDVPLHLATAAGPWWLEPGPPIAPTQPAPAVDQLRARAHDLAAELAALRARLPEAAEATTAAPAPTAVPLPRPWLPRLRPTLPAVLVAAGVLAVGDAVATVAWQEPVSAFWAGRQQHALQGEVTRLDRAFAEQAPAAGTAPIDPAVRLRAAAATLDGTTRAHHALGRLAIPRLHADYVVIQGTDAASLRRGPGHYAGTALPGEPGTVGIAGHRTTYGAPFRHLDALRPGDAITMTLPYGRFVYRVEGTRIVKPQDVSSLRGIGRQRLVLTACHPLYSAAQRLVVLARLAATTPRGPAASGSRPADDAPAASSHPA